MAQIRLSNLVKRFDRAEAVAGMSLTVESGQAVALLGPSGCGKTTTLKCIAGLEDPTSGEIYVDGQLVAGGKVSLPPEKRDIGMVFQSYALWPHMTVFGNVAYPLEVRGLERAQVREKVQATLELVGLAGFDDRLPAQLSGGQQQRVALARGIVARPRILLFDEPLSNLDAKLRAHMRGELKAILGQLGATAVYVTHDRTEAMAICDRIVLMNEGRIVQQGTPQELFASPESAFAADFMGGGNFLEGAVVRSDEVECQGQLVRCPVPARARPGDDVTLVLRAELLRLSPTVVEGDNCWPVRIRQRLYLGVRAEYVVALGDHELRLEEPALDWQPGTDAYLRIAPRDVICLATQGAAA
jgi:iron(III) transport system ATP-binding protein